MPDTENSPGQAVISIDPFRSHPLRWLRTKAIRRDRRALDLLIVLIRRAVTPDDPGLGIAIGEGSPRVHAVARYKALDRGRSGLRRIISTERRFVTSVGSGGIGNTTAAASALVALFVKCVYPVDFGFPSDPSLPPGAPASEFVVRSDHPIGNLVSFLRDRRILTVLDCCEHLIKAVAGLTEQIFRGTPRVHIQATSRQSPRSDRASVGAPMKGKPNGG